MLENMFKLLIIDYIYKNFLLIKWHSKMSSSILLVNRWNLYQARGFFMVIDWIAMKNPFMTSFPIIPNSSPREWIWIFFLPPFSYLYNPAIIFSKVFCVLAAFFAGYGMRWPQSNINFEDFSLFFPSSSFIVRISWQMPSVDEHFWDGR